MFGSSLAPNTLISAIRLDPQACNVPLWFDRVGKKPSMKVDLAICSDMFVVSIDSAGHSFNVKLQTGF